MSLSRKEYFHKQKSGLEFCLYIQDIIYSLYLFFEFYVTSIPEAFLYYNCISKSSFSGLQIWNSPSHLPRVLEMSQSSGNVKAINGEVKDKEADIKMHTET